MALKAVLDNLDELYEILKSEYKENTTDGKFYLDVTGVDTLPSVKRIKDEAGARRIEANKLKTELAAFGDLKPDEVRTQLARIPELETLAEGKIDDTKIEKIVQTRLRQQIAPVERERDTLKTQLGEKDLQIQSFQVKEKTRVIHDVVRTAATKSKIVETAQEDALALAERVFEVDDQGNVVTKDNAGFTPGISAEVWLTEMQPKRPHWWGTSQGGGGSGSRLGGSAGENPFSAEHWNMTKQGAIVRENPTRAEQLARSAGTTIGGRKPAPRK